MGDGGWDGMESRVFWDGGGGVGWMCGGLRVCHFVACHEKMGFFEMLRRI